MNSLALRFAILLCLALGGTLTFASLGRGTVGAAVGANVRGSPNGKKIFGLARGQKFTVLSRQGNWYRIKSGGRTGWVHKSVIRLTSSPEKTKPAAQKASAPPKPKLRPADLTADLPAPGAAEASLPPPNAIEETNDSTVPVPTDPVHPETEVSKALDSTSEKTPTESDARSEAAVIVNCAKDPNCSLGKKKSWFDRLIDGDIPEVDYAECGLNKKGKPRSKDPLTALACNNYNEAGREGYESMKMVCKVVLARLESPHFPKTVAGVVYEEDQFSWAWYKANGRRKINGGLQPEPGLTGRSRWNSAIRAAVDCLKEGPRVNGRLWTFYFAKYASPPWRYSRNCTAPTGLVPGSDHKFMSCVGLPDGKGRRPKMDIAKKKKGAKVAQNSKKSKNTEKSRRRKSS